MQNENLKQNFQSLLAINIILLLLTVYISGCTVAQGIVFGKSAQSTTTRIKLGSSTEEAKNQIYKKLIDGIMQFGVKKGYTPTYKDYSLGALDLSALEGKRDVKLRCSYDGNDIVSIEISEVTSMMSTDLDDFTDQLKNIIN